MLRLYTSKVSAMIPETLLVKPYFEKYMVLKKFQSGATGDVYHVIDKHRDEYTIKRYKNKINHSVIFNEFDKLKHVSSFHNINKMFPQDVKMLYDNSGHHYLQYRYIDGTSTWTLQYKILKHKNITELKIYIWNICNIAYKLQKYSNITHLDIKPENLIYKNNTLKFIDFGSSRFLSKNNHGNMIKISKPLGTPYYAAPEIFKGYYNNTSDVYCIGRTMQFFCDKNMYIDSEGIKLLSNMLELSPTKRPSLYDILSHRWFSI